MAAVLAPSDGGSPSIDSRFELEMLVLVVVVVDVRGGGVVDVRGGGVVDVLVRLGRLTRAS